MGIKQLLLNKKENQTKAIIYIDKQNNVRTAYDNFEEVEGKYSKDDIVKVFKPKKADLRWLEKSLTKRAEISDGKTMSVELDPSELYEMILRFTSLDLGLDKENKDDMKQWKEIFEAESDIILTINREITSITTMVMKLMISSMEEVMDMPDSMKEAIILNSENKKIEKDIEKLKKQVKPKEKAKPNRIKNKNKQNVDVVESEIVEVLDSEIVEVVEAKYE